MSPLSESIRYLSAVAFLGFGAACLMTEHMVGEFERYGLARFRVLVGWLEIAGAVGLLLGAASRPLLVAAAGGLALLMLLGLVTRVVTHDSWLQMLPAAALLALNVYLVVRTLDAEAPA